MKKVAIVTTAPEEISYSNHRNGVWTCPYCDYDGQKQHLKEGLMCEDWYRSIEALVLEQDVPFSKRDAVIAFSRCLKCKDVSWIHITFQEAETLKHLGALSCASIILKEQRKRFLKGRVRK